jgi:hypothetical protein
MRDRVVGGDLAYHAAHGVATLLGAPLAPGAPPDAVTHLLARRSRAELYDYLAQVQEMVGRNPAQARQILADHPQLTKALFQMQVCVCLCVRGGRRDVPAWRCPLDYPSMRTPARWVRPALHG